MGENEQVKVVMPRREAGCDHEHSWGLIRRDKVTKRVGQRQKPMRFRSLHHHSTYSYLDGYQLPEAHVRRATELNMDSLALTEHGNVSSHVLLEKAAKEQGVKPIFGVELYCGEIGENATQRKNHLTILAETQQGYSNMLRLVSRTYSEGFYYEPTADGRMLSEHNDGLIVLSGCQGSLLFTSLVGGKNVDPEDASYRRGRNVARKFKRVFGDRYYLEVQAFPELDLTRKANPMIAQISEELGIPMVASLDCHYTLPTEKEIQQVLHNVRGGGRKTLEEQAREWGYASDLCPPVNDNMLMRKLVASGLTKQQAIDAILASEDIASRCDVSIPNLPMLRYPLPRGYRNGAELWRDWLEEGWRYRGCDKLPGHLRAKYRKQLRYEMSIIEEKDFVDYFLFVSDAVRWAKDHGIAVGPARGSAAASLACWLLRITEVNPMLYPNLVFERFIDISRADLPDIDLDFHSDRRQEVTQYLVSKYGRECVNNIGTFSTYKAKMALDDAARVYKVPAWKVDKIKDVLLERSSGDLRASATIEDTVEQFDGAREVMEEHPELGVAMDLEGNIKGFGVHAAGLVLSNGPVDDVCAIYERRVKDTVYKVVSLDKKGAEEKNLLKLDFLGLNTMTLIDEARKHIGMTLDELYNLPLDDKETIRGFQENDVIGVFQFDGRACRYVSGALRPDSFKEVCDTTALARPGPLHNGAANEYIDVKSGVGKATAIHPALDNITKDTFGQVVYQEQILRIVREIGDFDWTASSYIRRIISRKIGEQEFNRQYDKFRAGAARLHPDMTDEECKAIWGLCITAGSYAFNAAHSVAYGLISYWCMYFKRHYPAVFFAYALQCLADQKHQSLLRDATRHNIEVLPPEPGVGVTWSVKSDTAIQAGLSQIPGIGEKTAQAILDAGEFDSWWDLLSIKGIGKKTVEKIIEFTEQEDPYRAHWLDRAIAKVKAEIASGELGDLPEPTKVSAELPYHRGTDIECVWLGAIHSRNVRDIFEWNRAKTGVELNPDEVRDPHLNEWMLMVGDDETDQLSLRVDRWKYPKLRTALWNVRIGHDLVLVRGVKPGWVATRQISVSDLWVIDPDD